MLKLITLNNGNKIPALGFGTWQLKDREGEIALRHSIEIGYRHFDCAWIYNNEELVGKVLNNTIKEGKVNRKDLFVTSKLWNCFHRPENVCKGLEESLVRLNMDYVDLYLIHWPISYKPGKVSLSEDEVPENYDDVDLIETWKAMEKLVDCGKVKSIGLSNFNIKQIQYILNNSRILPSVLQVEIHLYLPNTELVEFCKNHKICVTAYSPLGSPGRPWKETTDVAEPLQDPIVINLSEKHKCMPGQILIAHILQRGLVCIPKSSNCHRIEQNFASANIQLSDEDMKLLDGVTIRKRYVAPNVTRKHKEYPFEFE